MGGRSAWIRQDKRRPLEGETKQGEIKEEQNQEEWRHWEGVRDFMMEGVQFSSLLVFSSGVLLCCISVDGCAFGGPLMWIEGFVLYE